MREPLVQTSEFGGRTLTGAELGERLKTARTKRHMTQSEAAEATGVSLRGWQNFEHGENLPGTELLFGLQSLGFSIDWLLSGAGPMMLAERAAADPAPAPPPLDLPLLEMVIEELERFRAERGLSWSPERRARLIGLGYGMMLEDKESSGGKADAGRLAYLFKAAS